MSLVEYYSHVTSEIKKLCVDYDYITILWFNISPWLGQMCRAAVLNKQTR